MVVYCDCYSDVDVYLGVALREFTGIGKMLQDEKQIAQISLPILHILVNSTQLARVQHCLGLFAVVYRYRYSDVIAVGLQHV